MVWAKEAAAVRVPASVGERWKSIGMFAVVGVG